MRAEIWGLSCAASNRDGTRATKQMPTIGPGVREIRIHTDLEHRVFYVASFAEAVYVLHAFEKRTRKTAKHDLDLAGDRFRALVTERRTNAQQK